jgi:hypothetical protein
MVWFHTVVLPLATLLAVAIGVKKGAPAWKFGVLVLGCALMLAGLWMQSVWSTLLLIAGGVSFFAGVPRLRAAELTGVPPKRG